MDDAERISGLYREYWRCMIAKDADGLRSMMTDDYYLLHMTGVKQSAETFLKGLQDGTFRYYSADRLRRRKAQLAPAGRLYPEKRKRTLEIQQLQGFHLLSVSGWSQVRPGSGQSCKSRTGTNEHDSSTLCNPGV